MAKRKNTQDPGTGTDYKQYSKRVINKDGSFNVLKSGLKPSYRNTYQELIKMSWPQFFVVIFAFLIAVNALFALLYVITGVDGISSIVPGSFGSDFLNAFFFSFQSFTTVGYGAMAPISTDTHIIVLLETVSGWLCFALVTGILYGRFSKPSARLKYSKNILIAPYKDNINCLQFRIANMRKSMLINMEATVMIVLVDKKKGQTTRQFLPLELERDKILFFPLNWTIVHPIDEKSPLYNKSIEDLRKLDMEVLTLIKGFDDTFSQTVHSRYSYKCDELIMGAKFVPAYDTIESGDFMLDFDKMDEYDKLELN
ncbi:ion channel [Fulvivirga lutea]|uniref:Potassium transporter n=1 Tax=Fulvivirga lutea TaxID=2810512 RepID=A0A974ZZK4_9BACT|nr:ion channel [Fulvivirga lutea]QSE96220.1 potassium transporter [Fulvivirga lutea]